MDGDQCAIVDGEFGVEADEPFEHVAASAVGQEVEVTATSSYADGRLHRFSVMARNVGGSSNGKVVGTGEVTRVVVDAERFLGRISS